MDIIQHYLRKAREKSGLSVREVAEKLEVTYQFIHALEDPKKDKVPSLEKAVELADLYQISLDELIGRNFTLKETEKADE